MKTPRIAVIIPCYNEAVTIAGLVNELRMTLPEADIVVCDNRSSDNTAELAKAAGATVVYEPRPGKGNAVRRLFNSVDADVYLMLDGDATYDVSLAPFMIQQLQARRLDMLVGKRMSKEGKETRAGHTFGRWLFSWASGFIFGQQFTDVLSGYRVFSRAFVKSFPVLSAGFEIETELTVHALQQRMAVAEAETPYYARPTGSESKLRTYRDGLRILLTIMKLVQSEKPLLFFWLIGGVFAVASLAMGLPIVWHYWQTGLVPRLPLAMLSASVMILAMMFFVMGILLNAVAMGRREAKMLAYLNNKKDA
ncbi:MAG: glycosyltransferase [Alphaproteobacteria bacterium]